MKLGTLSSTAVLALASTGANAFDSEIFGIHGIYGTAFGGLNTLRDSGVWVDPQASDLNDTSAVIHYRDGYVLGGALGTSLAPGWRAEVEASYRRNKVSSYYEGTFNTDLQDSGDAMSAFALMANVWRDFELCEQLSLRVGAGIGTARVKLKMNDIDEDGGPNNAPVSDSDWVFAGQAGAGLGWTFGNGMIAGIDYRLFATEKPRFQSHDDDGDPFSVKTRYVNHSILLSLTVPIPTP